MAQLLEVPFCAPKGGRISKKASHIAEKMCIFKKRIITPKICKKKVVKSIKKRKSLEQALQKMLLK